MRILIAEDDPISSRVLATTLTKWGHEVVMAQNGLEAWDALQKDDANRAGETVRNGSRIYSGAFHHRAEATVLMGSLRVVQA